MEELLNEWSEEFGIILLLCFWPILQSHLSKVLDCYDVSVRNTDVDRQAGDQGSK